MIIEVNIPAENVQRVKEAFEYRNNIENLDEAGFEKIIKRWIRTEVLRVEEEIARDAISKAQEELWDELK